MRLTWRQRLNPNAVERDARACAHPPALLCLRTHTHTEPPLEHRCAARLYGCGGLTERSRTVSAHQRPWLKAETRRMRSSSCGPWVARFSCEFCAFVFSGHQMSPCVYLIQTRATRRNPVITLSTLQVREIGIWGPILSCRKIIP